MGLSCSLRLLLARFGLAWFSLGWIVGLDYEAGLNVIYVCMYVCSACNVCNVCSVCNVYNVMHVCSVCMYVRTYACMYVCMYLCDSFRDLQVNRLPHLRRPSIGVRSA